MDLVILGAGAVGGYFGARLIEADIPVSFLVRERRAAQLKKHGLRLNSVHGDYSADAVRLYTDTEEIPRCDLVIVAVKGYHVGGTLPQLRKLVKKGAKVLPFLNGMEHYQLFEEELGKGNVLGGLAFIITTLDENGGIVHTSDQHEFVFGALHPSQKNLCDRLESELQPANMNVTYSKEISVDLWQKYGFITSFSGITTTSRLPIGRIRKVPETLRLFQKALEEMQALAVAYEAEVGKDFVKTTLEKTNGLPEEGTSSMHQDFRKGLPIEVEGLQGGALRMAKSKKISLPVIETMYALLKPYEKGECE